MNQKSGVAINPPEGDALIARLCRALAGTRAHPRPLAALELPPELSGFVDDAALAKLRAAAVLLPVIARTSGPMLLLTRRAQGLRKHGGQISLPGGTRDPGDPDSAATALRESREEVGLQARQVRVVGYLDDYPTVTGFRITPVVALVDDSYTAHAASPDEVAEVFEIPLDDVLDPNRYRRLAFERDGMVVPYYEIRHRHHRIWGATAGILHHLCLRVGQR